MLTRISKGTTNVVFLANATIAQRSCVCGKVRAVNVRAAVAFMGGCDLLRREPCMECGCQVDAARGTGVVADGVGDGRRYADDDCSVCGAAADTLIRRVQYGYAVRVPICLDCASMFGNE